MQRKAIGATFILLLMTQVISAQENSGSVPFRPGLHLKNDAPSRTKEQKEYDKAIDREYQSELKKNPDAGKRDLWANIRPTPPAAAKNKQ
jgi:Na+-transporting NADH:ubiquinone oxidoreductase subunit NqrF